MTLMQGSQNRDPTCRIVRLCDLVDAVRTATENCEIVSFGHFCPCSRVVVCGLDLQPSFLKQCCDY